MRNHWLVLIATVAAWIAAWLLGEDESWFIDDSSVFDHD